MLCVTGHQVMCRCMCELCDEVLQANTLPIAVSPRLSHGWTFTVCLLLRLASSLGSRRHLHLVIAGQHVRLAVHGISAPVGES